MTKIIKEQGQKFLSLTELTAVTPLDGRYREKVADLAPYVSEFGLIRTRFEIEAKYLIALSDTGVFRKLSSRERTDLNLFGQNISVEDARKVKQVEEETRHDVKALERTFRNLLKGTSLEDSVEFIHFGLTSEDVNNLAYRLILRRATEEVVVPVLDAVLGELVESADQYKNLPMLGRTHGQPAIPTTLGKEIVVFASRISGQLRKLQNFRLTGKLNGAIGNFNAQDFAYPDVDWDSFSAKFVKSLGFEPNLTTTQINPYEDVIEYSQILQRINGIIIDLDQDFWRYISDNWFIQEVKAGEVGSSTMPQKVNPIDFENSEGNLIIANGVLETLSRKLAQSRLQRDLSDSTTIRNIGTALGFSLVGYKSVVSGLSRISPNSKKITEELNQDWTILTEAVQTLLRKLKVKDPYSLIASLTRGEHIDGAKWNSWVDNLPIAEDQKDQLCRLSPENYIGLAVRLTEKALKDIRSSRRQK